MQDTTEDKADRNKSKLLLDEAKELRETADKLIKESEALKQAVGRTLANKRKKGKPDE